MTRRSAVIALLVMALAAASCSNDSTGPAVAPTTQPAATVAVAGLLPWPSDTYTRADPSTPTGRRIDLPADSTPANASGTHIGVAEWNRNDGFSPSSIGLTIVPRLDIEASKLPRQGNIGASLEPSSPVVIMDTTNDKRLAGWAEIDSRVTDPERRLLRIVPAAGLPEGHRITIALSGLVAEGGATIAPLTWSFTVASGQGLTGRLRHMWSDTVAKLGDGAPPFTATAVRSGGSIVVNGTFEMPNYLSGNGGPGSVVIADGTAPRIPPWLAPRNARRFGSMTGPVASRKAGFEANPWAFRSNRPSIMNPRWPCWRRSAWVRNFVRSTNSSRTVGTSAVLMPRKSNAQNPMPATAPTAPIPRTSLRLPRSPWPYSTTGAGALVVEMVGRTHV